MSAPSSTLEPLAATSLAINEVFYSIQGESTFAGRPCVFVRLTGCDLRCTYCDTEYAFYEGRKRTIAAILDEVKGHGCPTVEVTGGEPLLQKNAPVLLKALADAGYTVLIETSGAHDIGPVDPRVHRIMDLKCPTSGETARNRAENLPLLKGTDEVKFVVGAEGDLEWAEARIAEGMDGDGWPRRVAALLFSPVFGHIDLQKLAAATQAMQRRWPELPLRMQVQLHKLIWDPKARGV